MFFNDFQNRWCLPHPRDLWNALVVFLLLEMNVVWRWRGILWTTISALIKRYFDNSAVVPSHIRYLLSFKDILMKVFPSHLQISCFFQDTDQKRAAPYETSFHHIEILHRLTIALWLSWKMGSKVVNFDKLFLHQFLTKIYQNFRDGVLTSKKLR